LGNLKVRIRIIRRKHIITVNTRVKGFMLNLRVHSHF